MYDPSLGRQQYEARQAVIVVMIGFLLLVVVVGMWYYIKQGWVSPEPGVPMWLLEARDSYVPEGLGEEQLAEWSGRLAKVSPTYGFPGEEKKLWACTVTTAACLRVRTLQVLEERAATPDPVEPELIEIVRDYLDLGFDP